jgi:hypothetical protein
MDIEVKPVTVNVLKFPENIFLDNAAQALRVNVADSYRPSPRQGR